MEDALVMLSQYCYREGKGDTTGSHDELGIENLKPTHVIYRPRLPLGFPRASVFGKVKCVWQDR